jgi:hypothetical protein
MVSAEFFEKILNSINLFVCSRFNTNEDSTSPDF